MNAAILTSSPDRVIDRLEDQIHWYDQKSASCRRWYKRLKVSEIALAAVIPLLAASGLPRAILVAGSLGVLQRLAWCLPRPTMYRPRALHLSQRRGHLRARSIWSSLEE
jgi:hypothetical protein